MKSASVIATGRIPDGYTDSLAVVGGAVVAAVTSGTPVDARLVAFDARTLDVLDSVDLEVTDPQLFAQFQIAASASRVYATWALNWAFEGVEYSTAVVPFMSGTFGTPEPLTPSPLNASAVATDRAGGWLALGGDVSLQVGPGVELLATGDEIVPTVEATARIAKKKLRVTGVTTSVAPGTKVTIHVRTGKKYVAQKKTAKVRADGTFSWQQSFRGKTARLYVVVGEPGSQDSIRTKAIRVSRARSMI